MNTNFSFILLHRIKARFSRRAVCDIMCGIVLLTCSMSIAPFAAHAQYQTAGQPEFYGPPLPNATSQQQPTSKKETSKESASPRTTLQTLQNTLEQQRRLYEDSLAKLPVRRILFSGLQWKVRFSNERTEPGNNFFSDKPSEVFVDAEGKLHLTIKKRDNYWFCTEVVCDTALGYGTYSFQIEARLDTLDKNIVLNLGVSPDSILLKHSPSDVAVRFTKLGAGFSPNTLQYAVKSGDTTNNAEFGAGAKTSDVKERLHRPEFPLRMNGFYSSHGFHRRERIVEFASYHDHGFPTPYLIDQWEFQGSALGGVKVPANTPTSVMRLSLWAAGEPVSGKPVEIIIKKFQFVPEKK